MLISEVKEEMRKRGLTIAQLANWSHYSPGFVGQVLKRTKEAAHLPARMRRTLEEVGILERTIELPTERQLAYLKALGFAGEVASREEASTRIRILKDQQEVMRTYGAVWPS